MARTSYKLHHGENKLQVTSRREQVTNYIMARTSYKLHHGENKLQVTSWREQVTFRSDNDDVRFILD